jgi:hypothetical protein
MYLCGLDEEDIQPTRLYTDFMTMTISAHPDDEWMRAVSYALDLATVPREL